jgi:hypothetical protein
VRRPQSPAHPGCMCALKDTWELLPLVACLRVTADPCCAPAPCLSAMLSACLPCCRRYNHYAGRLGIPMPETAKLLSRYPIEHHEFHWGLGTLSHADTAYQLWRPGLSAASLC